MRRATRQVHDALTYLVHYRTVGDMLNLRQTQASAKIVVPSVRFARTVFDRQVLDASTTDAIDKNSWRTVRLEMNDSIGGPTRCAIVMLSTTSSCTYVKSVTPLHKREFEWLFAFGCGAFEAGRVIMLEPDVLHIDHL